MNIVFLCIQVRDLYFNMLTENEVWQLYTFYQMDFKLFEYEVDPKYLIRYYKTTVSENWNVKYKNL